MKNRVFILYFIIALFLPLCANADLTYKIIDLGGNESCAYSINDNGQVVGSSYPNSSYTYHACLFDPTGGGANIDLEPLEGSISCARSINNSGDMVGWVNLTNIFSVIIIMPGYGTDATLFDPSGEGRNKCLGTGSASSINNLGQIVGGGPNKSGSLFHAISFDPTGNFNNIDLGEGVAISINDKGQIVGDLDETYCYAVMFDPNGNFNNINLGALENLNCSTASSINNNGQVVGKSFESIFNRLGHATSFDPTGGGNNIDLGTLGGDYSEAFSINDHGQIVGTAQDTTGFWHAALFDPTGGGNNSDLNTLIDPSCGWTLTYAYSINNNGWIVGQGINPDGFTHAYLLTPEPTTIFLLGLGALFLKNRRK
jgi:probable HAF family extracellular repeat protein